MSVAIVTGAGGLFGSEAAHHFSGQSMDVITIDNGGRGEFFGEQAPTGGNLERIATEISASVSQS